MLRYLLLLAFLALNLPGVSAAAVDRRQDPSVCLTTFCFSYATNKNCKSLTVQLYDAALALYLTKTYPGTNAVTDVSIDLAGVSPARAVFWAVCDDRTQNFGITRVVSYGITYSNPMIMLDENNSPVALGDKVSSKLKLSIMLIHDGRKQDSTIASININKFKITDFSGSGTLTVSYNLDGSLYTIATLPSSLIVKKKTHAFTGVYGDGYLVLKWAPSDGNSRLVIDPTTLASNSVSLTSLSPGTRGYFCDTGMSVRSTFNGAQGLATNSFITANGTLSGGTYTFICMASDAVYPIGTGSTVNTMKLFA